MEIKYFYNPKSHNCCQCTDCLKPHLAEFEIEFIDISSTDAYIPEYIKHSPSIHITVDRPSKNCRCKLPDGYNMKQFDTFIICLPLTFPSAEDIKQLIQKIKSCI